MAHNKLRRDLAATIDALSLHDPIQPLLNRSLTALGGRVQDVRPEGHTVGTALPPVEEPVCTQDTDTYIVGDPGDQSCP